MALQLCARLCGSRRGSSPRSSGGYRQLIRFLILRIVVEHTRELVDRRGAISHYSECLHLGQGILLSEEFESGDGGIDIIVDFFQFLLDVGSLGEGLEALGFANEDFRSE